MTELLDDNNRSVLSHKKTLQSPLTVLIATSSLPTAHVMYPRYTRPDSPARVHIIGKIEQQDKMCEINDRMQYHICQNRSFTFRTKLFLGATYEPNAKRTVQQSG